MTKILNQYHAVLNINKSFMKKNTKFNLYLCGPNDNGINVKKIANQVLKLSRSKKKIIYGDKNYGWIGDVPIYNYNVKRLNKEGFIFKKTSLQAITKTIKEYLDNEENLYYYYFRWKRK